MRKNDQHIKSRIVSSAWSLFYRYGFENTTIDDIVEHAHTSKGSFYYYFRTKADLLDSLSYLFDEKYEELLETLPVEMGPVEKLLAMNEQLFTMIENTVPVSLLSQLCISQISSKGDRHLLDPERTYFKAIRLMVIEGQEKGLFRDELTVNDIIRSYALFERAIMYDWCMMSGNYSLSKYSRQQLSMFLKGMMK